MDIVSLENCRLCLGETNNTELISIWSATDNREFNTISEQITQVAAVTIEKDDNLSQLICTACCYSTDQFLHFKMQCETNEKIQRELLLKSMEDPVDSTTIEKKIIVPLQISLINHESPEYTVFMENMKVEEEEEVVCDSLIADEIEFKNLVFDEEIGAPVETIWLSEVGKSVVECDKCGELFDNDHILNQHTASGECDVKSVDQDEEFVDDSTVDYEEELPRKPQAINPKKLRPESCVCETCGKVICSPTFLRRHIKAIHPAVFKVKYKSNPVKCGICGKFYRNKTRLECHQSKYCKVLTPEEEEQKRIIRNAKQRTLQRAQQKRFCQCNVCGKMLWSKTLEAHMRVHRGEKLKCQYCGKMLASKTTHRSHERMHTGENPLECKVCGKIFYGQMNLAAHSEKHREGFSRPCPTCNRTFKTSSLLHYHKPRCQKNARNFHCETCGKDFLLDSDLRRHTKLHTAEKTHVCQICGYKTFGQGGLNHHMLKHSGNKFYCDLCPAVLSYKDGLRRHKKNLHPETIAKCDGKKQEEYLQFEGAVTQMMEF